MLLRQCLIHRQLKQLCVLGGGRFVSRLLPTPSPQKRVGWRVEKGEVGG